jgi:hypothetical protein
VDVVTGIVALAVGAACIAVGLGVVRSRPGAAIRVVGWSLTIAGAVAVVHAASAWISSAADRG